MDNALRQPNVAELFERVLVPSIFDRYARDLIERARPIGPSDRVLDLGCGTGIVARVLRERLGGAARISGLDSSPLMIEKARSLAPEIDWHEGNATALSFADRSFDLVLCQEMLQFVPDRMAALREVRRVLTSGGRFIVSTWRPRLEQKLYEALGAVAERHLGTPNDKRYCLDASELRALLTEAGFVDVRVETVSLTEEYLEVPVRLNAMASNFDLSSLDDVERERRLAAVEADSNDVLAGFAVEGGFRATSSANVATATSPAVGAS